jgi:hypothetical protein
MKVRAKKSPQPAKDAEQAVERKHRQPGAELGQYEPIYAGWINMGNGKRRRGKPVGNY